MYIAHDLGSTNGTHVNGRQVEYAPLSDGDVIRLGDVLGVVGRVAAREPTAPARRARAQPEFGPGLAALARGGQRVPRPASCPC